MKVQLNSSSIQFGFIVLTILQLIISAMKQGDASIPSTVEGEAPIPFTVEAKPIIGSNHPQSESILGNDDKQFISATKQEDDCLEEAKISNPNWASLRCPVEAKAISHPQWELILGNEDKKLRPRNLMLTQKTMDEKKHVGQLVLEAFHAMHMNAWGVEELMTFAETVRVVVRANTINPEVNLDVKLDPEADDASREAWQYQLASLGFRVRGRCQQESVNMDYATLGHAAYKNVRLFSEKAEYLREQRQNVGQNVLEVFRDMERNVKANTWSEEELVTFGEAIRVAVQKNTRKREQKAKFYINVAHDADDAAKLVWRDRLAELGLRIRDRSRQEDITGEDDSNLTVGYAAFSGVSAFSTIALREQLQKVGQMILAALRSIKANLQAREWSEKDCFDFSVAVRAAVEKNTRNSKTDFCKKLVGPYDLELKLERKWKAVMAHLRERCEQVGSTEDYVTIGYTASLEVSAFSTIVFRRQMAEVGKMVLNAFHHVKALKQTNAWTLEYLSDFGDFIYKAVHAETYLDQTYAETKLTTEADDVAKMTEEQQLRDAFYNKLNSNTKNHHLDINLAHDADDAAKMAWQQQLAEVGKKLLEPCERVDIGYTTVKIGYTAVSAFSNVPINELDDDESEGDTTSGVSSC